MKVLQIITHMELGGAQKATFTLSRYLKEKGYDVFLISSPRGLLYSDIKKFFGKKYRELKFLRRELNPFFDIIAFFSLYIYIKEGKFDLVHTHCSKAGILGRWAAFFSFCPRIVHTIHGFAFHDYQNWIVKNFYIIIERFTAHITDKLIAVSEEIRNKGLKYKIGCERQYNVVYELVTVGKKKQFLNIDKDKFRMGMVGALKIQKSPQDFVKAAYILSKKRDDVEFFLVGDGKLRTTLERAVEKYNLGNKFKFLGWQRNVYRIMSTFDVLILPSIFEGQPHVVIESLALGIPVVASAVDGIKDLIKNGENGFLVKPHSPLEIARIVENLLDDIYLRKVISTKGRDFFVKEKKLDYLLNLAKIEQIYQDIY